MLVALRDDFAKSGPTPKAITVNSFHTGVGKIEVIAMNWSNPMALVGYDSRLCTKCTAVLNLKVSRSKATGTPLA